MHLHLFEYSVTGYVRNTSFRLFVSASLSPNLYVAHNIFISQNVTYSNNCGKVELSCFLNAISCTTRLVMNRVWANFTPLHGFITSTHTLMLLLMSAACTRVFAGIHMYSLIFAAVIVSLFCYCGNNYTIFNTFYYGKPTPKTYQAAVSMYKKR